MNHKMTKIITLLIMFLVWPSFTFGAPSVTNVSSALSDGNNVTITGSSFGSGPNVVIFDDFESGTVGQTANTGPGSAKFGGWSGTVPVNVYSSSYKLSGSKALKTPLTPGDGLGASSTTNVVFPAATSYFMSGWSFIPSGTNWPGENAVNPKDGINWKKYWMVGKDSVTDDYISPVQLGKYDGANWKVTGYIVSGNDPTTQAVGFYCTQEAWMSKGVWKREWAYVKGSTTGSSSDGEVVYSSFKDGKVITKSNKNANTLSTGGNFLRMGVNGYGRKTSPSTPYFDDFYLATGPNAQARVEVGNASTYTASSNLTILTPKSWTANSISAEVNKGNFPNGSAYLYVFDASGVPNATGYPVTFGASGPDTTPPVVSSTVPTNNSTGITKNSINSIIFNEDLNCSTVNTSSVTMSPNKIASVTCDNSVITITPQNQADSTTYTITAGTAITNTTGLHLASPYSFSYTTATPTATCATDASLCTTASTCTTNHPSYNFCSGETPACKSSACTSTCSQENWYLCTNQTDCQSNNLYWWENACRTIPEPQLWYGANLITNPKLDTWSNGLPVGWSSYIPSGVSQNSLGARIISRSGIHKPSLIEPDTTYVFAYNLPVVTAGFSEIWYYNTSIFNSQAGTVTGSFTTPSEPISDHGFYFTSTTGSDIVINDIVLKRATLTGCSTDPALCETEATCTAANWNYCDGVCKEEPCNAEIPVAPCGLGVF